MPAFKCTTCNDYPGSPACASCSHQEQAQHGVKYDQDKPAWSLMPWEQAEEVVRVLMYGANKYPQADNWKRVPDAKRRYIDAMHRHLIAVDQGEKLDDESGCHHMAHAICCALFYMWHDREEFVGAFDNMIRGCNEADV